MATTLNPSDKTSSAILSNGDLTITSDGSYNYKRARFTTGRSGNKYYFEVQVGSAGPGVDYVKIGFINIGTAIGANLYTATTNCYDYRSDGRAESYSRNNNSYGSAAVDNDVIMVAVDLDAKLMWFGKNGTWFNSGNPATGTNSVFATTSDIAANGWATISYPFIECYYYSNTSCDATIRLASGSLSYTPPSGFLLWDDEYNAINKTLDNVTSTGLVYFDVLSDISATLGFTGDGLLYTTVDCAVDTILEGLPDYSESFQLVFNEVWDSNLTLASTLQNLSILANANAYNGLGMANLQWSTWTLRAEGGPSDAAAALTWPTRSLTAYGGGSAALTWPAWSLTVAGTVERVGTAELTWPTRALLAEGLTGGTSSAELTWPARALTAYGGGSAALTWPVRTLTVGGTLEIIGTAALAFPVRTLTADGLSGGVGTVAANWPIRTLTANGLTGGIGTASLAWPVRTLTVTVAGSGVATETTYAVNLSTGAVTQLLLGAFDKLVTAHGRLYGLRSGALVRLDGDMDGAETIPATIRFAPQQFGTLQAKRLDGHVYLNLRENDGVTLAVVQDETTSWDYQTPTDNAPGIGTHRVKVGRGLVFHSLSLTLKNRNGGRLDVGGLELPVLPLSRKPK